jgi:hypothetical protein
LTNARVSRRNAGRPRKKIAALKADGSITAWGNASLGGTGAPSSNGYTKIYSNYGAFAEQMTL